MTLTASDFDCTDNERIVDQLLADKSVFEQAMESLQIDKVTKMLWDYLKHCDRRKAQRRTLMRQLKKKRCVSYSKKHAHSRNPSQKSAELSSKYKDEGNAHYRTGNIQEAIEFYTKAIAICPKGELTQSIYYANRAACYYKLETYQKVIDNCDKALEIDGSYIKALLRRAMAYEQLEHYKEALSDYEKIYVLEPTNHVALSAKVRLPSKVNEKEQKTKDEVMGKLKEIGNGILGKFGMSLDNFKTEQKPDGSYSVNFKQ